MNIIQRGEDITILNDTYNANPQSMRAAVEVLSKTHGSHKVAVLGDMFELGTLAPALHAGVGDLSGQGGDRLPGGRGRAGQEHIRRRG